MAQKELERILLTAISLSILAAAVPLIADGSRGPSDALSVVVVDILDDDVQIDISLGQNRTGTVSCRAYLKPGATVIFDSVDVVLYTDFPEYVNSVNLSADRFTLTEDDPEIFFTATVNVREKTSSAVSGSLEIAGESTLTPSDRKNEVEPDSAVVRIKPYYGGEITFDVIQGTIIQGDSKEFTITVINHGNADDTFHLEVRDPDLLKEKGITVTFESSSVPVREGGSATTTAVVKVSDNADRGFAIITVEVWSEHKGSSNREESTALLTVNVEEKILGFLRGTLFQEPIYLWGSLAVLLVILGLIVFGIIKLRERIAWKRAINRMKRPPSGN
ncbi:MAG: choice-of-anchor T family protein [Thermoplasmatota archaeon]